MEINTFEEAISFSKQKEDGAIHFYQSASRVAKNLASKVMFREMVAEERKHLKMLDDLSEADIESIPVEKVPDLKISQYTEDVLFSPDLEYRQILIVAMKKEEAAHRLYSDMAKMTDEPKLAKLFDILAQEEAKHKLKLESEYDDHVLTGW